jgi:shikimate kinase
MTDSLDLLRGVNLYLVGMMGAGKSTVGQAVAKRLGYRFLDTDMLIESVAQRPISDIFATDGEAAFRDLETAVLEQVVAYTRSVVATGGGMVLRRENWGHLRHGVVVWLDVPLAVLTQRLKPRPEPSPVAAPGLAGASGESDGATLPPLSRGGYSSDRAAQRLDRGGGRSPAGDARSPHRARPDYGRSQ